MWQRLKALKVKFGGKNNCMRPAKKKKKKRHGCMQSPSSASSLTILVTLGTRCLQLLRSPLHHEESFPHGKRRNSLTPLPYLHPIQPCIRLQIAKEFDSFLQKRRTSAVFFSLKCGVHEAIFILSFPDALSRVVLLPKGQQEI